MPKTHNQGTAQLNSLCKCSGRQANSCNATWLANGRQWSIKKLYAPECARMQTPTPLHIQAHYRYAYRPPATAVCSGWPTAQHNTKALRTHKSRQYEPQLSTATPVPTTTTTNMFVQSGLTHLNTLPTACLYIAHPQMQAAQRCSSSRVCSLARSSALPGNHASTHISRPALNAADTRLFASSSSRLAMSSSSCASRAADRSSMLLSSSLLPAAAAAANARVVAGMARTAAGLAREPRHAAVRGI